VLHSCEKRKQDVHGVLLRHSEPPLPARSCPADVSDSVLKIPESMSVPVSLRIASQRALRHSGVSGSGGPC
jgi:hypothetical protein